MFRTADGLGVEKIYLTGFTPYPVSDNDQRLPYLAIKIDNQIHKTALGAETYVKWEHKADVVDLIKQLKAQHYQIVALEQSPRAITLQNFIPIDKLAIIVGQEIGGIEATILALADVVVEIPMSGQKESFNVAEATAMALYHIKTAKKII